MHAPWQGSLRLQLMVLGQSSCSGCAHGTMLGYAIVTRSTFTPSECLFSRLRGRPSHIRVGVGRVKAKRGCREGSFAGCLGGPSGCPMAGARCALGPAQQMAMMCHKRASARSHRGSHSGCSRFPRMDCIPVIKAFFFFSFFFIFFFQINFFSLPVSCLCCWDSMVLVPTWYFGLDLLNRPHRCHWFWVICRPLMKCMPW